MHGVPVHYVYAAPIVYQYFAEFDASRWPFHDWVHYESVTTRIRHDFGVIFERLGDFLI
jgi:hypothetical protein